MLSKHLIPNFKFISVVHTKNTKKGMNTKFNTQQHVLFWVQSSEIN